MDNKATKKNSERLDKDDIEYQRMQAIFFQVLERGKLYKEA